MLERCATHQTACVILGDFNVHYGDNRTCNTRNFTELFQEAEFRQHVREPTHVGDHILDLVITRNSQNVLSSTSVETLLTDHHVIRCDLVTGKPTRPRRQIKYRKYASIDNTKLMSDLENSDLFNNPNYGVDELYTQYNSTTAGFIDSHAPLITRVIIIRPKTPWYNSDLSDAKRLLRRAERRWRQTRLVVHRDMYTSLRDAYREKLVACKSAFYCEKIHESAFDVKAMYRVTNEITGRKQPPVLPECSDSQEDLAERFRVYFPETIINVRSTMHCRDAPPSMQPIGNDRHHLCTLSSFTPTTAAAIVRLVNKCPWKCCALDPWPTTLLKTNIDIIAPVLADIINVSLESATVPVEMKHALVTPLLKKTGLDANYRARIVRITASKQHSCVFTMT